MLVLREEKKKEREKKATDVFVRLSEPTETGSEIVGLVGRTQGSTHEFFFFFSLPVRCSHAVVERKEGLNEYTS